MSGNNLKEIEKKADEILQQLSLEEKAGLCSGQDFWRLKSVDRLNVPAAFVCDGPHGLRKQNDVADHLGINSSINSVCYPAACLSACSFSEEALFSLGETLGKEAADEGVYALLGPAINIKRSPLCGRNFEYFSEDPFLSGVLSEAYVKGVQSNNVGACPKHFAANSQEFNRMSVSSNVSKRALYEIYLPAFKRTVLNADPYLIMCAYNKINGEFCSQNEWLLSSVLRGEWGFRGAVVSDWGAVYSRVDALKAGLELEMPASGGFTDKEIAAAVSEGKLKIEALNSAVKKILTFILRVNFSKGKTDKLAHRERAKNIAEDSMVLLKNNGVLPLKKGVKLAVIGEFAVSPRYQGGGSSHINPVCVKSFTDCLKGENFNYYSGYNSEQINEELIAEAERGASEANIAIVFAGLPESYESEGYDRDHMSLPPSHNELISRVMKVQKNTVVVLYNGSAVELPWIENAAAVLETYLGGEAVSEAVKSILFGEVNPSGRLAETFPIKLSDNPSYLFFPGDGKNAEYNEDIFVGYRYYLAKQQRVLFPFGYGLSYTTFNYTDLKISEEVYKASDKLRVSVSVTNTGKVSGKEVVQLYVKNGCGIFRPFIELKAVKKVFIKAGETVNVEFTLTRDAFEHYSNERGKMAVESGAYSILICKNCEEIILSKDIEVIGDGDALVEIDNSSTVGELMKNSKTAVVLARYLDIMKKRLKLNGDSDNNDAQPFSAEALKKMVVSVPLRSVRDLGKLSNVEYENMLNELRQSLKE